MTVTPSSIMPERLAVNSLGDRGAAYVSDEASDVFDGHALVGAQDVTG